MSCFRSFFQVIEICLVKFRTWETSGWGGVFDETSDACLKRPMFRDLYDLKDNILSTWEDVMKFCE